MIINKKKNFSIIFFFQYAFKNKKMEENFSLIQKSEEILSLSLKILSHLLREFLNKNMSVIYGSSFFETKLKSLYPKISDKKSIDELDTLDLLRIYTNSNIYNEIWKLIVSSETRSFLFWAIKARNALAVKIFSKKKLNILITFKASRTVFNIGTDKFNLFDNESFNQIRCNRTTDRYSFLVHLFFFSFSFQDYFQNSIKQLTLILANEALNDKSLIEFANRFNLANLLNFNKPQNNNFPQNSFGTNMINNNQFSSNYPNNFQNNNHFGINTFNIGNQNQQNFNHFQNDNNESEEDYDML